MPTQRVVLLILMELTPMRAALSTLVRVAALITLAAPSTPVAAEDLLTLAELELLNSASAEPAPLLWGPQLLISRLVFRKVQSLLSDTLLIAH